MFARFFAELRSARVPVSIREYLAFLEALDAGLVLYDAEGFYFLARTSLVKDERHIDRFDRVFAAVFNGLESPTPQELIERIDLPVDWLRKLVEKHLTPEERAEIEALGGFDRLMQALAERMRAQKGRHQGGSKWIGTAGTSPFGAYGYNPEGVRIGQDASRHQRAVKVWDRREFRNLDDGVEIGTRNIKLALRRLRRWAREGAAEELDLTRDGPPDRRAGLARRRYAAGAPQRGEGAAVPRRRRLDGPARAAGRGAVLGGALRVQAPRVFYFHNCLYEGVWRDNRRRWDAQTPTAEVLRTFGPDYRVIFVGDAAMSPYEVAEPGGANEHWNAESGEVWLTRLLATWGHAVWLNPLPRDAWDYSRSVEMIAGLFGGRMYPLTLSGLEAAIRELAH